ncbi:phosphoglycolate phosphatase [Halobellus ruber]|uniref:Phosphoglycolate phosphatase n=1 Tax=Halobellus ruber TaxID=2761102 RepID=A0A7J9SGE1_9EURY|nr:phosphoglycolate phosphatase [Halobellus ruber]MBB6645463.1 phosphoglycolate phosphatase [Halobellus ruber]
MTAATPPLVLDIDGTLTDGSGRLDPRIFEYLPEWEAPLVLATGKAFPYPVTLCHFLQIDETVIAENGGVVLADGEVSYQGDPERAAEAVATFEERGGDLEWSGFDSINNWRETEIAASVSADLGLLRSVAAEYDLEVFDTGYAYHLKTPGVEKGVGLRAVADTLDLDPAEFVAVGDSINDASMFEVAGRSFAVANADDAAREAADAVVEGSYFDGTASVLDSL